SMKTISIFFGGTRDSGLGTRDSGLGTRDSGLGQRLRGGDCSAKLMVIARKYNDASKSRSTRVPSPEPRVPLTSPAPSAETPARTDPDAGHAPAGSHRPARSSRRCRYRTAGAGNTS